MHVESCFSYIVFFSLYDFDVLVVIAVVNTLCNVVIAVVNTLCNVVLFHFNYF